MCDTRLPLTEYTPAAHHGRRFDIGASLPDLSPGPHLVPRHAVPPVSPLPQPPVPPRRSSVLLIRDPHCTTRTTTPEEDQGNPSTTTTMTTAVTRRNPCATRDALHAARRLATGFYPFPSHSPHRQLYRFAISLSLCSPANPTFLMGTHRPRSMPLSCVLLLRTVKCHFTREPFENATN